MAIICMENSKGSEYRLDSKELNQRVNYWAYGSNLNMEQMAQRCPSADLVYAHSRAGFKLEFRNVANVKHTGNKIDDIAHGAIYSITLADLYKLDGYEGVNSSNPNLGKYKRISFSLPNLGRVWYYQMVKDDKWYPIEPPYKYYLETIKEGYAFWNHTTDHLQLALDHANKVYEAEKAQRLSKYNGLKTSGFVKYTNPYPLYDNDDEDSYIYGRSNLGDPFDCGDDYDNYNDRDIPSSFVYNPNIDDDDEEEFGGEQSKRLGLCLDRLLRDAQAAGAPKPSLVSQSAKPTQGYAFVSHYNEGNGIGEIIVPSRRTVAR